MGLLSYKCKISLTYIGGNSMRKMDEMELKISGKSIKITWFITVIALFVIGFIQKYKVGGNNTFLILATSSVILNMVVEHYYVSKVNENNSFMKFIGLVAILTAIIILVVWWLSN